MNSTEDGPHMDLDDFRARLNEAVADPPPMPSETLEQTRLEGQRLIRQRRLDALAAALVVMIAAALLFIAR